MRVLRAKAVRKFLKFYKIVFAITAPYHVLLDGTFIYTALKYKLDITHRLESLLQETSLKLYVLQSNIDELRTVGEKAAAALEWTLRCCEAIDDRIYSSLEPVAKMMKILESAAAGDGNTRHSKRYFIASQDKDVRQGAGSIPGIPVIYLNQVTLVLEPPSRASLSYRNTAEDLKTSIGQEETAMLSMVTSRGKRDASTAASAASVPLADRNTKETMPLPAMRAKKHRANAPNPLSNIKASDSSQSAKKKKMGKFRK